MATTPILADIVSQVGGEHVQLSVLIPAGTDPHAFEPTPQDAARLAEADLVVVNGLGLEESLTSLLHEVEEDGRVVIASEGIDPLDFEHEHEGEHEHEHEEEHEHEDEHEHDEEHEHEGEHHHEGQDPHVWMNPLNVSVWVDNIAAALSAADGANASEYQANADAYKAHLVELDHWIHEQVAMLPAADRKLVTDHESFNYFAEQYGFEIVGVLIPSFSTLSEVSAGELAELENTITTQNVPAIFIGASMSPGLAERVSADTGVALVVLYGETLSGQEGPAPSYLELMRYNVSSIVDALR
ncbi:MAG: zinc ABC transporter substrate-binding protein [Anaerolineales bacterium]|nr:zinc ABC transporter substrate-binding protein [Anaerolineales bacterium]